MSTFFSGFDLTVLQMHTLTIVLTVILHFLCATAIAKDIGHLHRRNIPTVLLPSVGWLLAGLISGLLGLIVYWLMHHSALAR